MPADSVGRGLGLVIFILFSGSGCGGKDKAPHYETAPLSRGKLVARVTATGTLSALVTVQVGSQVSGRIAQLGADFNDRVKKGQVIAKIDPQLYQAAAEQARANLVAANGNLAKAKAQAVDARHQATRSQQLADKNLVASADRDTAMANADAAEAGVAAAEGAVAQAKANLHQAEVNLNYTTIVSPIDGVVISRAVDVGQTVAASLSAPTLYTIAQDLTKMQVDTSVAEADVGKVQAGMKAGFTVDAYPGERFDGTIRQIRNSPTTQQNVVTYDAVIDVGNPDLKLKPGMTATVTFVYAQKDDVLKVPNTALRFRPPEAAGSKRGGAGGGAGAGGDGGGRGDRGGRGKGDAAAGERTVYRLEAGQPSPVRIKLGFSDGTSTEVVDGPLKEGDAVITDMTGGAGAGGAPGGAAGGSKMRGPF